MNQPLAMLTGTTFLVYVFISLFGMSLLCGHVAKTVGRSFANYFFLSLCLTPFVSLLILSVKGKYYAPDVVYYCPKCKEVYKELPGHGNNLRCNTCGDPLVETTLYYSTLTEANKTDHARIIDGLADGLFRK